MHRHPIRKAITLFFVYSIFIIGVFFLQFRSDSVINKNFGALRISVDQSVSPDGTATLKNRIKVNFKGIGFSADEARPAILKSDNNETTLTLQSFEENGNGFTFNFDNDSSLAFLVSGENEESSTDSRLSVIATIPAGSTLHLNYKPISGFTASEKSSGVTTFSAKGKTYNLNAGLIDKDEVVFSSANSLVTFVPEIKVQGFQFASIDMANVNSFASESIYEKTVLQTKNALINNIQSAFASNSTVSEAAAVAYVAEMAARNSYKAAIENVPDSIKHSQRRSYISSTFFNSLVSNEPSLRQQIENHEKIVNTAIMENSLDAFIAEKVACYFLINPKRRNVTGYLKIPANMEKFEPTLVQAYSILGVYSELKRKNASELAELLAPVLEKCVQKIGSCCVLDGEKLTLSENGNPLSKLQSVNAGGTLVNFGKISGRPELSAGGRMIVNSALVEAIPSDLRELSDIYAILEKDNPFYPHVEILDATGNNTVWAWTSGQTRYKMDEATRTATISIRFPTTENHYIMVKGVDQFNAIDIYDVAYRSDPRFESYNSSGYVYNADLKTLFLKSRHKTEMETVKLYFGQRPTSQPVSTPTTTEKPKEPTETKPATSTTATSTPTPAPAPTTSTPAPTPAEPATPPTPAPTATPQESPAPTPNSDEE